MEQPADWSDDENRAFMARTPAEVALAAAAAEWHDAEQRMTEAKARMIALVKEHEIGITRASTLTGISRVSLTRWTNPAYERRQRL